MIQSMPAATSHTMHVVLHVIPCLFSAWRGQWSHMSLHFHTTYKTHVIPSFMYMPCTYFPVLLAYESRLVMQFYKSNATSAIVAR